MKDLSILKYNDLREVMWLDHHNNLNGTAVDDASLDVMLRIEKTMSRLDVVGDDTERFCGLSDAEVFEHNSKGREIEGLNLDSEDDYLKWEKENARTIVMMWPMRVYICNR